MKQLLFILTIFPMMVFSQNSSMFDCPELTADISLFNDITGSTKTKATKLMEYNHMNDDKEIQYQYVVETTDTIDILRFMTIVDNWVNVTYNKPKESLVSKSETSCEYKATVPNVGVFMGYMKTTIISASSYLRVDVKPNKIRVTGRIKHYNLAQGSLSGPKNVLTLPGDVFPFKESSNEKSYAMAYFNSNANILNLMHSFFNYINKNYNKIEEIKKANEDW